jgi:hypothetical protein
MELGKTLVVPFNIFIDARYHQVCNLLILGLSKTIKKSNVLFV